MAQRVTGTEQADRGRLALVLSLAALLVVTLLLHREVLFSGAVYHMDDAADNYYPARVAFRRALSEGTLPTWERGSFCGWPLIADPYYGFFYPLNAVFYLGRRAGEPPSGSAAGVAAGLGLSAALHMLLGGVGMLLLLRRRVSPGAALLGALSFSLSSFLVVRIRHIIFVQLCAWLPWLLLGIEVFLHGRRRWALMLAGVSTAMLFIVGAHSLLHFAVLLLLCYLIARIGEDVVRLKAAQRGPFLRHHVLPLVVVAVLGTLTAAVTLLPTLMSMPYTSRALGTDYQFASSYAWPSWRYVQVLLMPDLMGVGEFRGSLWLGKWNHWEISGYYQGAAMLLLAVLGALVPSASGRRDRAERLSLLLLCLAALIIALGDKGPLHPLLYRHLPLYAALRCPVRALFVLVVAVPMLGAYGADFLLLRLRPALARPGRRWNYLLGGLVAALCAWAGWVLSRQFLHPGVVPLKVLLSRHALGHLALVLALFVAIVALRQIAGLSGKLALVLLCALTAFDQYRIDRGYLQPQPADFAYGTERFAAVQWLVDHQHQIQDRFTNDPRGPFRLNSVGETLGLENAAGYGSVLIWRYTNFLYILNHGQPYPYSKQRDDLAAAVLWQMDSPLLDLLNVRWLVGPQRPSPRWLERFRPEPGAPPNARFESLWDPLLRVFENPQAMPLAWVGYRVENFPTEAQEAQAVARPGFDPRRVVVLGSKVTVPAENGDRPLTPARVLVRQRHRLVIEAEAQADGVLVVADAFYPGWSATVDGHRQPILPADLALRAVPLAAGKHRVEMTYRSRPMRLGGALSGIGICGLILMFLWYRKRDNHGIML